MTSITLGATTTMFFDDHPVFRETSRVATSVERLNLRHLAMIEANRDILEGARVLDLASHDGRWAFAALQAGASHVTGVEFRRPLVRNARQTFRGYGLPPKSYKFIRGDMFRVLEDADLDVDVVQCFGFLYHTLRYPDLLKGIRRLDPEYLVVDTKVCLDDRPVVELKINRTGIQANAAADALSHRHLVVAGWPSVSALEAMLDVYDFDVEEQFDWPALIAAHPEVPAGTVRDYTSGHRVTLRCRNRTKSS